MSVQLTNEQLLRFYVKDTQPKLEFNNDDIQGQGGDANSVLMSEIQRLIDVGIFNTQDTKGNMKNMQNMQNSLIDEVQRGFTSVNDSFADNLSFGKETIDDIGDNSTIYVSTNDVLSQNIITSLNDLNTKLEDYNTTGTTSQGALFASLTNLQTALANSNTNNTGNTTVIDNLSGLGHVTSYLHSTVFHLLCTPALLAPTAVLYSSCVILPSCVGRVGEVSVTRDRQTNRRQKTEKTRY
jgi:hypothetical protein